MDIVLHVLKNSQANACSDVLSKVVAYQHGFVNYSGLKFFPDFQNKEVAF